jgi:predicted DNA binding CopG/RHH family protein
MKIVKQKTDKEIVPLTIRIPAKLLQQLTDVASKHDVSRQKLITAIMEQALSDKKFQISIKD